MTMTRRAALRATAAGALTASMTSLAATRAHAQATSGPIRLPLLMTLSGPVAPIGIEAKTGGDITAALINKAGGINGRQVELIWADDKGRPNDGIAAARELLSAGHKVLGGVLLSSITSGLLPLLAETKTVLVGCSGNGLAFTHEQYSPFYFPGQENEYQRAAVMGQYVAEKLPDAKSWGGLVSETDAYIKSYASFAKFAAAAYAKTGKTPKFADVTAFKFGTNDFRQTLAVLAASGIDAVYNMVLGADGLTLWQQAQGFGLETRLKGVMDQTIDLTTAKALKKRLPPNLLNMTNWYHGLYMHLPQVRAFFDEYVARTGDRLPSGNVKHAAQTVDVLARAVGAVGTDADKLIPHIEGGTFPSLKGDVTFRKEDHLMLTDIDIIKIVPSDTEPTGIAVLDPVKYPALPFSHPAEPGKPFAG